MNSNVIKKIIDLCLMYEEDYSKLDIEAINLKIKTTYLQLEYLYDNKPLFFEKKKIIEYNEKVKDLEDKLLSCYNEIEKEVKLITSIQSIIND